MIYVAHRINTVEQLKKVPQEYGVEIDLRDKGDGLILQHDPFGDGERFEEYLQAYNHKLLILNIKSERIEFRVLELLRKYNIKNYFFLDSSFPMIYQLCKTQGEHNIAVRFSEFEGLDTILAMQGLVRWVWVDCFTHLPLTRENYQILQDAGFNICLVSPELQGRPEDIAPYKKQLDSLGVSCDAVCTKVYNVGVWRGACERQHTQGSPSGV